MLHAGGFGITCKILVRIEPGSSPCRRKEKRILFQIVQNESSAGGILEYWNDGIEDLVTTYEIRCDKIHAYEANKSGTRSGPEEVW